MKYKILYVYHSMSTRGGLERVLSDKMNYLAERMGHEVYFLTTDQGEDLSAYDISNKIHWIKLSQIRYHDIYNVSYPKRFLWLYQFKNYLKKELLNAIDLISPDFIIATTSFASDIISGIKCKSIKICESHMSYPYIMKAGSKHSYMPKLEYWTKSIYDILFRRSIRKYDELVVLTKQDKDYWAPYRSSVVISNPITYFPEKVSETSSKKIIAVGRLHGQKGYDLLIKSWSKIAKHFPEWSINIFGDGTERQVYIDMIREYGLEDSIFIHPSSSDIFKEYHDSEFLVLSSRAEGWGLVLVENMSCGRPCVSYNCESGPAEIITDGVDGLLIEPEDIDALANGIERMITHPEERKSMGYAARESSKRFYISNIMNKWQSLFDRLYKEKHKDGITE